MAVQTLAAAPRGIALGAVVKDAALAAVVALILAFPMVGLQTVDTGGGALGIHTRFDWVAYGVAAVFVGRLILGTWWAARAGRATARRESKGASTRLAALVSRYSVPIALIGLACAIAYPLLPDPIGTRYNVDLGTTVLIYVMLGWGLNVVVGLAGLLDLGYVGFYAVGAYTFGLLSQYAGFTFWEALPLAGLLAATFGVVLGFPVLRLRGDYLAIVTLGFGEMIRIVLLNWADVTNGPNGISGIPRPTFFGMPFTRTAPNGGMTFHEFWSKYFWPVDFSPDQRVYFLYFVILLLALVTNFFTLRIRRLPVGRAWEALREDEVACRALGINPTNIKLSAFAIGAMCGGFAGSFFATRQGFISPESFTFIESAIILAIVVLGGMGSQIGVVLAAIVLVCLPEFGRQFSEFRMLIFGAAMVGIMVWRPRGLLAHRDPSIRLYGRAGPAAGGSTGAGGPP